MADVPIEQQAPPDARPHALARPMALRDAYDLLLLAGFALLVPALLLLPPWLALVRVPLGLAAVLLAPGYALQAALFPRRDELDGVARAGLSIGLSVALVPLAALLLDWLPWGIRPWPIVGLLAAWIALVALVAALRRRMLLSTGEAFTPAVPAPGAWWGGLPPRLRLALAGVALAFIVLVGGTYAVIALPAPSSYLTEFYVLGKAGLAEDYPRVAAVGETLTVTMGITNREREARSYRVELWAADSWQAERRRLVAAAGPVTLAPGATDEQPISWAMPWAGADQTVELLLFSGEEREPYRRLKLWLNVQAAPGE